MLSNRTTILFPLLFCIVLFYCNSAMYVAILYECVYVKFASGRKKFEKKHLSKYKE